MSNLELLTSDVLQIRRVEIAEQLHNPYWEALKDEVTYDGWTHCPVVSDIMEKGERDFMDMPQRGDYTGKYAWSITDPQSLDFVRRHAGPMAIDPMAGTGYWAAMLIQLGCNVSAFDNRAWADIHKEEYVCILNADAPYIVRQYPYHTLLLMWPPYNSDVGFETVRNFRRPSLPRQKIIYIGEGSGGCTGTNEMHDELDEYWDLVCEHRPVQWFGIHDDIYVYERKAND